MNSFRSVDYCFAQTSKAQHYHYSALQNCISVQFLFRQNAAITTTDITEKRTQS